MPATLPPDLVAVLLEIIGRFPAGASIDEIGNELAPPPAQRTLSGWLLALESAGAIEKIGAGRTTRYRLIDPTRSQAKGTAPSAPEAKPLAPQAASSADAAQTSEELAEAMMLMAILTIVGSAMAMTAARFCLQQQALKNGMSVVEAKAYVERVMTRLTALTGAEAESYGVTAEQYAQWRRYCSLASKYAT